MKNTSFLLDERFRTEDEEQRKILFRKLLEQYIVDSLFRTGGPKR